MRAHPFLVAFAALLCASPAAADITARYAQPDSAPILVQVNDRGESRAQVVEAAYLHTGGTSYLVAEDPQGRFVVRLDDFTGLLDELTRASSMPNPAANPIEVMITEHGSETRAGRVGQVFRISEAGNPRDAFEIVISADPNLAPLARALALHFTPVLTASGQATPEVAGAIIELLGRGALLRFGEMWRLESVDMAPIAPSVFALPSAPLSREQLRERIHARRPR